MTTTPPPHPSLEPLFGITELADYLGVPLSMIYDWRTRGQRPRAHRFEKHLKFALSDVVAAFHFHGLSYPGVMTPEVLEVERARLALAPEERAAVIRHGLASLDDGVGDASPELDAEWHGEFRRRIDENESGQAEMLTGEEVDAKVDTLLAELRK